MVGQQRQDILLLRIVDGVLRRHHTVDRLESVVMAAEAVEEFVAGALSLVALLGVVATPGRQPLGVGTGTIDVHGGLSFLAAPVVTPGAARAPGGSELPGASVYHVGYPVLPRRGALPPVAVL